MICKNRLVPEFLLFHIISQTWEADHNAGSKTFTESSILQRGILGTILIWESTMYLIFSNLISVVIIKRKTLHHIKWFF